MSRLLRLNPAEPLRFSWAVPSLTLVEQGDGTVLPSLEGYSSTQRPGHTRLPLRTILLAIPVGTEPEIELITEATEPILIDRPLSVAPEPFGVERDVAGTIMGGGYRPVSPADRALPDTGHSAGPLHFEALGIMGGVQLGRITFYPLYPLRTGRGESWQLTRQIEFQVTFVGTPARNATAGETLDTPLSAGLMAVVANPQHLHLATTPPSAHTDVIRSASSVANSQKDPLLIAVASAGVTEIQYADLTRFGIDPGRYRPGHLQLTRDGVPVATQWIGNGDDQFEPGEALRFVAEPRPSRWTALDFYTLSVGQASRAGMPTIDLAVSAITSLYQTARFEQNHLYTPNCYCGITPAGRDGDRWVWEELRRPGKVSAEFRFDLPAIKGDHAVKVAAELIGFSNLPTDNDHRVALEINGQLIGHATWDGPALHLFEADIPAAVLQEGKNRLTLTLADNPAAALDAVWLDAFSLSYVPQQATAAPIHPPHAIRPLRSLSTADVGNATKPGADLIMIAPESFVPALEPLVAQREAQGLTVAVETVEAIYDQFDEGRPTPAAIHRYLRHAYESWSPRPSYVLLVGDGSNDPKGYKADSRPNLIPPYLAVVDPWIGETAADNRYVMVDGEDRLPDMLLGRLPVNSLDETEAVVAKIVRYETTAVTGNWNRNILFVADQPDHSIHFGHAMRQLAAQLPAEPWGAQVVELETAEADARSRVMRALHNGAGMVIYSGHSAIVQWGADRLLHVDDASQLTNEQPTAGFCAAHMPDRRLPSQ